MNRTDSENRYVLTTYAIYKGVRSEKAVYHIVIAPPDAEVETEVTEATPGEPQLEY